MSKCSICPRNCGIDRSVSTGWCSSPETIRISTYGLHKWEEPPLSGKNGAGTVFFTGCPLRCIYCQNFKISTAELTGEEISVERLSQIFFELVDMGAHVIDLVTPTHYSLKIAEALKLKKVPIPVVYNCSGYESVETLKNMEGLIDIYLPDFKYADSKLARELSRAPDYPEVAEKAIAEMIRQTGVSIYNDDGIMTRGTLIRHLILPLHTENSINVLERISEKFPGTEVSLMAQYTPVRHFDEYPELNRKITQRELEKVADKMMDLGIDGFVQDVSSSGKKYIPDFK
jgi:putative pyruvate formate lyase activating enzyme